MLTHRLQRWLNIKPPLSEHLMSAEDNSAKQGLNSHFRVRINDARKVIFTQKLQLRT